MATIALAISRRPVNMLLLGDSSLCVCRKHTLTFMCVKHIHSFPTNAGLAGGLTLVMQAEKRKLCGNVKYSWAKRFHIFFLSTNNDL